ncbi:MAG TPA: ATP-binding protein [Puia sp.]|nr:ATP-binding protein [Puia sp.]
MVHPKTQALSQSSPNSHARFWQMNTFIVLAMGCNLINFIYYMVDGMTSSATIEVSGIAVLLFFMICNLKGYVETPKLLSIVFVNSHSLSLCYVQGTGQGAYLYLFPFVMAMIFFLRVRKNDLVVTTFIIATTLNLLVIVLLFPYRTHFEPVTDTISYHHLVLNIIINFLLVITFFYFVLRLLDAKEKKVHKAAAAKARFMSNMSHELRTPLNAIIGTTHLLIQDHELLQHTDHFKVLKNSSEHMLQLVNEVLDFSKLDEGKLEFIHEPFDLSYTLRQAADSFATLIRQKNIALVINIDNLPPGKKVVGDEMRLKQVFLNLLSNAVKFTEAGSVTLQARISNLTKTAAEIHFSVTDTGIGIAPEKSHLIFESFTQADAETTRKYGGSGLGLSICKELVKKMGGDLRVSSTPEEGSCFYFSLQLPFQQQEIIAPKENLRGLKKLTGIRILLAEDNAVNRKIAMRFLHSWGASIQAAENGKVAWELFQQHPYDILLIDLEMPLMDGKQLLTEVRKFNKDIPAIAFTAAVYENMYADLQQHGFNGYLHKPFRPDEMHRNILEHLPLQQGG